MTKKYWNIPVDDEETYIEVGLIAQSNGFGTRGMGQQIKAWVAQTRAAPVCGHPKTAVEVQWMPTDTTLGETNLLHSGWYCPTCNRVYRQANPIKLPPVGAAATPKGIGQDPYGQPLLNGRKKRTERLGRTN